MAIKRSGRIGDVIVVVGAVGSPADTEWDAHVAEVTEIYQRRGSVRILVSSDGGGPTAAQRARLGKAVAAKNVRSAVLTTSVVIRGVVTAFSWFQPGFRAFAPSDFARAATHLELSPIEAEQALALLDQLRAESGLPPLSRKDVA